MRWVCRVLLALFLLPATFSVHAETRIALVVGNAGYKASLGTLANPVNDANAVAAALRRDGFDVDLESNLDQKSMKRAISRLGERLRAAGQSATGLFYYAGHGLQEQGENYLIPIDAAIESEADIDIEAVAAKGVLDQMENAGNAVNIIVLDACRNTPVLRKYRGDVRGLARMDAPTGSFVAYSTAPGETAMDGAGANSPFAEAFVAELAHPAESIDDMFINVRRAVLASTEQKQVPWNSSSLVDKFYFVPPRNGPAPAPQPSAAPSDPTADARAAWLTVASSTNADEIKAFRAQFPNSPFDGMAKARLGAPAQSARAPVQVASLPPQANFPPKGETALQTVAPRGGWGVDLTGMDRSVKPGDDFFEYANGNWFRRTDIPADRTNTGTFQDLQTLNEQRLERLMAQLEAKSYAALTPEEKQLRDLYDAFTDVAGIESRGLDPAKPDLARIAALQTLQDVARLMGDPALGAYSIFSDSIETDAKSPNTYVVSVVQSGLGMPNRDYYLNDSVAATRDTYKRYLATMLSLAGETTGVAARAAAVYSLESDMAAAQWPDSDRRNVEKTYNPMTVSELASFAPGFDWAAFFAVQGISSTRRVIVRENTAFPALAALFARTPVAVWRDYLMIHYMHNMAAYLPKAIVDADFDFYGRVLTGQAQQLARNSRALRLLDSLLPDPFGKLYVANYFPPAAKAKTEQLVANLLKAYDADIRKVTWMSDATRQKALDKLHAFTPHIGYPGTWRDFASLVITSDDLIRNVERSNAFDWQFRLARIDRPVDRGEWRMTPPTINAYYDPSNNSIFFPAAILQPPFFDPNADDAVNYGAIGAVIGHEISHAFDDQGSRYAANGTFQAWWTDEDHKAFAARISLLGSQFDSYEGLPGLHLNGKLTMGENVGDLSGLAIALKAYHASLGGKAPPVIDGFSGDQRFFLAFAQIWRGKYSDNAMRQMVLSNPHSPPSFRVLGPTRNIDAWYEAFGVKPGDKMYLSPDQRVRLW